MAGTSGFYRVDIGAHDDSTVTGSSGARLGIANEMRGDAAPGDIGVDEDLADARRSRLVRHRDPARRGDDRAVLPHRQREFPDLPIIGLEKPEQLSIGRPVHD